MTFHAYQRSRRMGLALRDVREGRDLLAVGLDQGYESTSGFRDAFARAFGRPPGDARGSDCLLARWIETPLGTMLALADHDGLRLLDFLDRRGLERKLHAIRKSLGTAIVPGDNPHLDAITTALAAYFTGARLTFDIPLIPIGSDWQIKVWNHLHTIPPGSTKSYSAMASDLDRPTASRAVGNANGLNFLSIVIPCHRVIRADGSLCGYGGGLWRKQWLLDHERTHALPNGADPVG
jgi:AraC family transcriptional regulator of adaptative response/methylated-DNA-[protein]-cysteine methyltransferase